MYFKTLRIAKLNVVMLLVQLISLCLSLLAFSPHFWVAAKGEALSLPASPQQVIPPRESRQILHWASYSPRLTSQGRTERLGSTTLVRNSSKRENSVHKVGVEEPLSTTMLASRHKVEVGLEANYIFPLKIKY